MSFSISDTEERQSFTSLTPSSKKSILKKTPSRSIKNVKFSPKVNVNCFFSLPHEQNHEILINRPSFDKTEQRLFTDEILWSNAQKGMVYKGEEMQSDLMQIEAEILLLTKENNEISMLINKEEEEFKKIGYKGRTDHEIDQLIIQNRSLQELINEKTKENEFLKGKILQTNKPLPTNDNQAFQIEKTNALLEQMILSLKNQYKDELFRFSFVSKGLFDSQDEQKALERELVKREKDVDEAYRLLNQMEGLLGLERGFNNLGLESLVLICAEFERLEAILCEKRRENAIKENALGLKKNNGI